MSEDSNSKYNWPGGYVFVGCMFVGMGLGMYFNNTGIGLMIGMGVGFLGMAVLQLFKKD